MRRSLTAVLALLLAASAPATPAPSAPAKKGVKAAVADKFEQLAVAMLPQEKVNEALGFFGPVTKKYLPVYNRFQQEYETSTNRTVTIRKYLPKADAAVAEAKKMKIPAKYETQKQEYIRMTEAFLLAVKLYTRL